MHNAPPVVYPVGRFVWGLRLALCLAGVTLGVLLGWLVWTQASAFHAVWAACVFMAAALCTAWCLPREFLQTGELAWDGETWHAPLPQGGDGPVHVVLTLDGGHFMLVSLRTTEQPGCLTGTQHALVRSADMPSRWHGFRCAVYSRRTAVLRTT